MVNIWVATDFHLWNQTNEPRHPYRSVSNLTKLAANYAEDIGTKDLFIYLGDLCDPAVTDIKKLKSIIGAIPCYKVMCKGNHDTQDDSFYREVGFDEICEIAIVGKVVFSHKPCIIPPDMINVHGHLHTRKISTLGYQHVNAYDSNFSDRPVNLYDLLDKAVMQTEYEWSGTDIGHVKEKFEKYTSLENDTYTQIIDLSNFVNILNNTTRDVDIVLSEAVAKYYSDTYLISWMCEHIRYKNFTRLMSPEEVEKTKTGSCHDQVMYELAALKKIPGCTKIQAWFMFEYDNNGQGGETHSAVTYKKNGKVYYIENAWAGNQGIHEVTGTIQDLFKGYHDSGKLGNKKRYPNFDISPFHGIPGMTLQELLDADETLDETVTKKTDINENNIPLDENFISTVPDMEWNRDKWDPKGKNILYICGLSGGGKTTLANQLSEEYKAEVIHLDDLAQAAFVGKMGNANAVKDMSPVTRAYWNSTTDHIKMYQWGDQRLALETDKFIKWMIKNHAGDGKLYIIEGCEIMYMDADYLINQPLIIKGTSAIRTTFWRFKRTYGQHRAKGESALKAFEHCVIQFAKIYKTGAPIAAENALARFKSILKAAREYNNIVSETINESVGDIHSMEKEEKTKVSAKYGLRDVGHYSEVDEEDEAKKKQQEKNGAEARLREREKQRDKNLKKARRVHKRNAFIRKVKKNLPFQKKDDKKPTNEDTVPIQECYQFELADKNLRFFDRMSITEGVKVNDDTLYPVYVILTASSSPLATMIRSATNAQFSHSIISFDSSMKKMYGFGTSNAKGYSNMGFSREDISRPPYSTEAIPYSIYVVFYTKDEINLMKKRLDYFIQNDTKFRYDFGGLFKNFFGIVANPEHSWFCSRFVADILNAGRPTPYIKEPSLMRPEDFKFTNFATHVTGGMTNKYNKNTVERITKRLLIQEKMKRVVKGEIEVEYNFSFDESVMGSTLDVDPFDMYQESVLNYQLAMMGESVVDGFIEYLKSFKVRFDKEGNVIITRREFDQLDQHFRQSLKMIKAYENAGNIEGVKDELCKIYYMIQLINEHYLSPKTKGNAAAKSDVKKDMLDLRSVMLNVFQQHLKFVTTHDPRFNFNTYYSASKYSKDTFIPKSVLTSIGKVAITALS